MMEKAQKDGLSKEDVINSFENDKKYSFIAVPDVSYDYNKNNADSEKKKFRVEKSNSQNNNRRAFTM